MGDRHKLAGSTVVEFWVVTDVGFRVILFCESRGHGSFLVPNRFGRLRVDYGSSWKVKHPSPISEGDSGEGPHQSVPKRQAVIAV
jgi:hypothetical protein